MSDETNVKGLDQLQAFLNTLPVKIERNILRGSLRAGMKVVQPVAAANCPSREVADALKIVTRAKGGTVVAAIQAKHAANDVPDNLAIWLEYGTAPHFISVQENEKPINYRLTGKRGYLVRASMTTVNRNVLKIGANFVGPTVHHPGAKPHPWLRPALDAQATPAVVASAEYMKKRLFNKESFDTSDITIEAGE